MLDMIYKGRDNKNHITRYEATARPDAIQLKEVLQIDVSGDDLQTIKNMGLPVAMHKPYTQYKGDLAKFIWDNL